MAIRMLEFVMENTRAIYRAIGAALIAGQPVGACPISLRVAAGMPVGGGVHANLATPVLMNNTSHHTGGSVESPTPTITTGGQGALVAPLTSDYYGNASTAHSADRPLGTVTTLDRHGLVGVVLGLSAAGAARALIASVLPRGAAKRRAVRA